MRGTPSAAAWAPMKKSARGEVFVPPVSRYFLKACEARNNASRGSSEYPNSIVSNIDDGIDTGIFKLAEGIYRPIYPDRIVANDVDDDITIDQDEGWISHLI
jgi:hypothetical protein